MGTLGRWTPLLVLIAACHTTPHSRDGADAEEIPDVQPDDEPTDVPRDEPLLDSDRDTISDTDEGRDRSTDTDGDTIPDWQDTDSDDDTIPDIDEAGDTDITTPPRDHDGDGAPSYRDRDSDNDSLTDEYEAERGTDPYAWDTDGDGYPDVVEIVARTSPVSDLSNPRRRGDLYFLVPHRSPPVPAAGTVVTTTDVHRADVFFLIEMTNSAMATFVGEVRSRLTRDVIPAIERTIPDPAFGAGSYSDFPYMPYGSGSDQPFILAQAMTADASLVTAGLMAMTGMSGGDGAASQVPALRAIATGAMGPYIPAQDACATGEIGYPCFRPDSVPIVVLLTMSMFHNAYDDTNPYTDLDPPVPTYAEMLPALTSRNIRVITVYSPHYTLLATHSARLSTDTGAVDATGAPLSHEVVLDGLGAWADDLITSIDTMARDLPVDLTTTVRDDETDTLDATIFIESSLPDMDGGVTDPANPSRTCVAAPATDTDLDAIPDTFVDITPGTTLCFDVTPSTNTTIPPGDAALVLTAHVDVTIDGLAVDSFAVYFLVPPEHY